MTRRMPSPAMVVALIALAVALSGTAIAAVDFASNAGAVDGKSAVSARASLRRAAGKLVATQRGGSGKGRIPARFIDGAMRGGSSSLARYLHVVDNQPGPVVPLAIIPGIGRLDVQCRDQDATPGVESTQTIVLFTGSRRAGVNVSRLLGRDIARAEDGVAFTAPFNQPVTIMNLADPLFQLVLQSGERSVFVSGAARSDYNHTANASCLLWGVALRVG